MRSYLSREITDVSRFAQEGSLLCDNMMLYLFNESSAAELQAAFLRTLHPTSLPY